MHATMPSPAPQVDWHPTRHPAPFDERLQTPLVTCVAPEELSEMFWPAEGVLPLSCWAMSVPGTPAQWQPIVARGWSMLRALGMPCPSAGDPPAWLCKDHARRIEAEE